MEPSRVQRARDRAGDVLISAAVIVRETVTDVVMERVTRPKYGDAVAVAMETLDIRIAALRAKPKSTVRDSETIHLLEEVRTEMQTSFEERWNNRQGLAADEVARG